MTANQPTDEIIDRFIINGRLVTMPSKDAKRRVILNHIAGFFEPGVHYPEKTVNEILLRFHDDYAALRRYLVEADFLSRENGVYWRSGGTVT